MKSIFFLASYTPVFLLLSAQARGLDFLWIRILLLLLSAIGLFGLFILLRLVSKKPSTKLTIAARRDAGYESVAFLAGYLLPLLTATIENAYVIWATAVYLGMAWVITIRSNLIQVNPLLLIFGYRILVVECFDSTILEKRSSERFLVAKAPVRVGDEVYFQRITDDVFLQRTVDRRK